MKNIVLVWASPKANPETKIWVQVVYLGRDPRKHGERMEKWDKEERRTNKSGSLQRANGAQSCCTLIEEITVWNTPQNRPLTELLVQPLGQPGECTWQISYSGSSLAEGLVALFQNPWPHLCWGHSSNRLLPLVTWYGRDIKADNFLRDVGLLCWQIQLKDFLAPAM